MKGPFLEFLFWVPVLFAAACSVNQDPGAQRAALLEAERHAVNVANGRDTQGILATYADDAVLILPNAPALVGKEAIRGWVERLVQNRDVTFKYQNLKAETSHDGTLGHTTSQYEVAITRPDGSRILEEGRWVQVWKKEAGKWKLVVEIASLSKERATQIP